MGAANIKATQRYAHLAPDTLADAAEAMGQIVSPMLQQKPNLGVKVDRPKTVSEELLFFALCEMKIDADKAEHRADRLPVVYAFEAPLT